MMPLYAVDLFAGAGGLSIGLERAGFAVALANEIEPDFAATYRKNHPETRVLACDIHTVDFVAERRRLGLPCVHLLAGGPPCQGFSTVGSKNRQDDRNSLFYEFLRATNELQPEMVLFENVSGFKRLYDGAAYHALLGELEALGYESTSAILEASDYGLPQRRQRTIVLAWRRHLPPVSLPAPTHRDAADLFAPQRKLTLMDAISDLPSLGAGEESQVYGRPPQNDYQRRLRGQQSILTEHHVAHYGERMRRILSLIPPGGSVMDLPMELRPQGYFKNTYARLLPDQPAPTITRNFGTPSSSRCVHPYQNRALSTREGARLQGFPDSYRFHGGKGSINLQIGNAVPPIFGELLGQALARAWLAAPGVPADAVAVGH